MAQTLRASHPSPEPCSPSKLSCVVCFVAAQAAGICYITSTYASCALEDIVATAPRGLRWFQLYMQSDKQLNKQLVQKVESLGFKALDSRNQLSFLNYGICSICQEQAL